LDGSGRVAIVTGAAGGIGRVDTRGLAEPGYRVVAADLRDAAPSVADVAGELIAVEVDVREESSTHAMASAALGAFGRIDVPVDTPGADPTS
jgi:NAD(P)-dependent dehydrogenase (short-subunit alcohol dehydrogenase family)